jgi:hypothetical protein
MFSVGYIAIARSVLPNWYPIKFTLRTLLGRAFYTIALVSNTLYTRYIHAIYTPYIRYIYLLE